MTKTIVQEYGPIYGEPVNGTVMGRPNGSVFVPATNTINTELEVNLYMTLAYTNRLCICNSSGVINNLHPWNLSAKAQDLSSHMQFQVFDDAGLTHQVGYRECIAGYFNVDAFFAWWDEETTFTAGDTLYLRGQLFNSGSAVATSGTIAVEWVEP